MASLHGVHVKPLAVHADDRGCFMEILREDDPFYSRFGQSSFSILYPGIVKAWHWHKRQDDLWFFVSGNAQVGLYDIREDSPTRGQTQVLYLGEMNRSLLHIPPGVAHGYRALGNAPVALVYYTTYSYDPADELRLPWDEKGANFSWTTENR